LPLSHQTEEKGDVNQVTTGRDHWAVTEATQPQVASDKKQMSPPST